MDFMLKPEHLKLLRAACIRWEDCETGAPAIDPKRPYGNSSVAADVREILGDEGEPCPHCGERVGGMTDERALELHRQTEAALRVFLDCADIDPGVFRNGPDPARRGRTLWMRIS